MDWAYEVCAGLMCSSCRIQRTTTDEFCYHGSESGSKIQFVTHAHCLTHVDFKRPFIGSRTLPRATSFAGSFHQKGARLRS